MKVFLKFIKSLIPERKTWRDIEVAAREETIPEPAPTIFIGWYSTSEGVDSALVNGDVKITYCAKSNTVSVLDQELTITTRIFTKVNNVLKKNDVDVVSKEMFSSWEQEIIDAQGNGKNTYKAKRFPKK